jgi:hypothetical protein
MMISSSGSWQMAIVCSVALACGACTPANREVGSACKNGVCPAALATEALVCVAVSEKVEIATDPTPPIPCFPRPLAQDASGKVGCQLFWQLPSHPPVGTPARCSDSPLLTAVSGSDTECELKQISKPPGGLSAGDGWFYDPVSHESCGDTTAMEDIEGFPRVRFTPAAQPPSGVLVFLTCAIVETADADGKLARNDGAMCALPPNSAKHANVIGERCLPKVPTDSFQDTEIYVETSAPDCETGVCLVDHLRGDPTPGCKEDPDWDDTGCFTRDGGTGGCALPKRCAEKAEVDARIYCSCRCDGPGVDPKDLCNCGDGFMCVDVLEDGPEALRGSYCVREGS